MTLKSLGGKQLPINVVGSSIFGRYNKISSEKTYNMFISDDWLVNFPGYERVLQLFPAGEGRGIFTSTRGDFLLVVVNAAVYTLNAALAPTFIGNLATNIGPVFIDENLSNQICIVDGVNAYIYNHSLPPNLTVQVLAAGLIPNYVTFHNSFFLFGNGTTNGNGAAWYAYSPGAGPNPLNIVLTTTLALQTKPDFAIAILRIPGQSANVIVFGTTVCEIHTQVGGTQNYRRVNTINVDYGCLSVDTIDSADDYVAWLGVNDTSAPVIMIYSGQGATQISTDGIDYLLGTIQFPAESSAMFYKVDGHLFYQLTFFNVADNLTLTYDFNTKKFFHLSDQNLNYHPARDYAYFNNTVFMLNINNAAIYETSTDITVYNENVPNQPVDPTLIFEIQRIRITDNTAQDDSDKFKVNMVAVTIEQGQDVNFAAQNLAIIDTIISEDFTTPPLWPIITEWDFDIVDEDSWLGAAAFVIPYQPRVDLSISLDGGITWSATVGRGLNPVGFRKNILQWNKLGVCNYITFKFRFWGLSRFVVNNGIMEISA
jgi:hypothetical protein